VTAQVYGRVAESTDRQMRPFYPIGYEVKSLTKPGVIGRGFGEFLALSEIHDVAFVKWFGHCYNLARNDRNQLA
jgi:hypothetical protein